VCRTPSCCGGWGVATAAGRVGDEMAPFVSRFGECSWEWDPGLAATVTGRWRGMRVGPRGHGPGRSWRVEAVVEKEANVGHGERDEVPVRKRRSIPIGGGVAEAGQLVVGCRSSIVSDAPDRGRVCKLERMTSCTVVRPCRGWLHVPNLRRWHAIPRSVRACYLPTSRSAAGATPDGVSSSHVPTRLAAIRVRFAGSHNRMASARARASSAVVAAGLGAMVCCCRCR